MVGRAIAIGVIATIATIAACSGARTATHSARHRDPDRDPRLVVLVIIDPWPESAFERERAAFEHGFARLLAEGSWRVGRPPALEAQAAPGLALLGTGDPPARTGIVADAWWHRELSQMLGAVEGENGDVTSRWLDVPGLADAIAASHTDAKAVAIALDAREARLPLGHAGLAIWFDAKAAAWSSSQPARWLAQTTTSTGAELVLDTARAAITGEQLGRHAAPDLLVIALPGSDDLDALLGAFLDELDHELGAMRWALLATSVRSERPATAPTDRGTLTTEQLQRAANNAATAVLGAGTWIDDAHYPYVFFSAAMLAQPAGELRSAQRRVIDALRSFPGIESVDRYEDLRGRCNRRGSDVRELCEMIDPARAGDLIYQPAPGWTLQAASVAIAHGVPPDDDRRVPVLALAPGRTLHAVLDVPERDEVDMSTVADTIADWLAVTPPRQFARTPPAREP